MSACGLDFGTSNTTFGSMIDGVPSLLPLESRETTIPSAIFYRRDGAVLIGRSAIGAYVDGDNGRVLAQGNPIRKKNLAKVLNWLLEQRKTPAAKSPTASTGDGKATSTNEPRATKNRVELRPIRKD